MQRLPYTEQGMTIEEKEQIILKHINYLVHYFDRLHRSQIKQDLFDLKDIITRYY